MREGSVGGTPPGRDVSGAIPVPRSPDGGPAEAGSRASGEDLSAFRRIYGSAGEGEAAGREAASPKEGDSDAAARPDAPAPFPMPWPEPLWAGLGGSEPAAGSAQAAAPADASVPELATELIGRLLVEDGDAPAAGREIRILLKHCALEGTEVRFRRDEGGLHLDFLPDSAVGGDFLRRKTDSLENLLRSRLGSETVKVSVLDPDAGDERRMAAGGRN